jgi:ligand-binding sensor domain-containing protein
MVSFNRLNISTLYRIILIFFLHQTITWSQPVQVNLKKEYPILKVGNDVWIGTPNGLYQYNTNYDSYKLFVIPGKEESQIRYMYYNNEWLWCVLDSGLAVLQVRLNQWMVFDRNSGLPSNFINNVAFQGNYVWLATDNGAARYDLLIEEWEKYGIDKGMPDSNIVKVIVKDDMVWFVTEKGFSEYDPHFEKWRHFTVPENENVHIYEAFLLNDNIWLLCNKGLIKFNPLLNNQIYFFSSSISSVDLKNVVYEDNNIWLLSNAGLFYVQTENQVMKEFEGNNFLGDYSLSNFDIDSYEIWIVTDKNILDWNRSAKTWKIADYASGISDSVYSNTYVSGGMTFLVNQNVIDYKLISEGSWKKFNLSAKKSEIIKRNKNSFNNLFDNEAGGNVVLGKYLLKLDGTRASYIYNKDFDGKITQGKRLDIKSQLTSGESRSIYGFYNNVDYSETMYGLRYKSIVPKDVLREINLGDFRKDPGNIPFGENASVFGANTWLQAGEKTERFKRSTYSLKAMTGQLRSEKTYEYYQGANDKFSFSIEDIDYIRNVFYTIPDLPPGTIPEVMELYLDDGLSSNNSGNILIQTTIAGITGDFDMLISNEDYYFHKKIFCN